MSNLHDPAQTYREEAQELLVQLEDALLNLEERPQDRDLVDTAFRALHTIKGSGSMFGFEAVAAFTHHVENAFDRVRSGELGVSRELINLALVAKDRIRELIQDSSLGLAAQDDEFLAKLAALAGLAGGESQTGRATGVKDEAPRRATWRIRFRLAEDALENGTKPQLLLDELRSLGNATVVALTDKVPGLEDINPFGSYLCWDVILTTEHSRSAIEDVFMFVIDDMELSIEEVEPRDSRIGEILVERGVIEAETVEEAAARQQRLGQLLVDAGAVTPSKIASALAEQQHLRQEVAETKSGGAGGDAGSIRVPAQRLDDLMDQVGELVIAQARLRQLVMASTDAEIKAIAEDMERLAASLRDTTMGIRMVPIGSLFGRFRRLVRDLSRELGKDVALLTSGEETELDKTVIERLADPLVHVIRNSIDHGIENAERRDAAGKPAQGRIQLSAVHSGAQVLITVKDDGKGLDRTRIRAKAEEQGLISAEDKLSDGELYALIFHPGFSTASAITNVSGRGVGMDVVKRSLDALRGTVEVASTPGEGTEVTLRLPLTLAIIEGLLVRVGKSNYAIPLAAVEECVELSTEEDLRSQTRNFLNIRGDLVPFLRLRELFNSREKPDPYQKVVIVGTGERRVGLVVDQLLGNYQTVIKSLSKLHADIETFSGATILGDGTVALILDVPHLVEFGQAREQRLKAS